MKDGKRDTRRGSGILEMSLCLLAFAMAVFGIVEFGYLMFVHQSINERARAALRYGVVNPYNPTAIQNMVLYGRPDEPEGVQPSLNLSRSMVQVERLSSETVEDRIRITVQGYTHRSITPWLPATLAAKPIILSLPYEPPLPPR